MEQALCPFFKTCAAERIHVMSGQTDYAETICKTEKFKECCHFGIRQTKAEKELPAPP